MRKSEDVLLRKNGGMRIAHLTTTAPSLWVFSVPHNSLSFPSFSTVLSSSSCWTQNFHCTLYRAGCKSQNASLSQPLSFHLHRNHPPTPKPFFLAPCFSLLPPLLLCCAGYCSQILPLPSPHPPAERFLGLFVGLFSLHFCSSLDMDTFSLPETWYAQAVFPSRLKAAFLAKAVWGRKLRRKLHSHLLVLAFYGFLFSKDQMGC